jgi:hypothetical protein
MDWLHEAPKSRNTCVIRSTARFAYFLGLAVVIILCVRSAPLQAEELTIHIKDFVQMPITGDPASKGSNSSSLARESYIREEPVGQKSTQ